MKTLYPYTYSVLRYVHDPATSEFVNVGVVLYSPEAKYVGAICRQTYARLSRTFPGFDADHFKSLMRHIQSRIEERGQRLASELALESAPSALEIAQAVLPRDDSSLQWAPPGSGRADDLPAALDALFDRMVTRYDERQQAPRRTEEDVWRHFRRDLETRRVAQRLQPKRIAVEDDEIEFQHAWKNGKWHCLEPVSFDLLAADSIRDKAHRWLGQLASVQAASEPFKVYLLIGEPQQEELRQAFQSALSILRKIPVEKELVFEQDSPTLAERVATDLRDHEGAPT